MSGSSDPDWAFHCGDDWRAIVLAQTGRDICDVIGPLPRRPRELAEMMRRLGVRDLSGIVTTVHGPAIPRRCARRGDIVRMGWALGYCRGDLVQFFGGAVRPMAVVDEVWAINRS